MSSVSATSSPSIAHKVTLIIPCKGSDCLEALNLRLAALMEPYHEVHVIANRTYGEAIKEGIALAHTPYVATMDSDGQHSLLALDALLRVLQEEHVDMVIGRQRKPWSPRGAVSLLLNFTASAVIGQHVPDFGSGVRVFRTDIAQRLLPVLPNGFECNAMLTLGFLYHGHRVVWFPVVTQRRRYGHSYVTMADGFSTIRHLFTAKRRLQRV